MESRTKILGHAIHPMLVVFPLGLLTTAVAFDVVSLTTHIRKFAEVAYFMIAAGVLGGFAAALFGALDWTQLKDGTRAKSVGVWHGLINVVIMAMFLGSFILREPQPSQPSITALILSFGGIGMIAVSSWLGVELIERHGVSVSDSADENAPSSFKWIPRRIKHS